MFVLRHVVMRTNHILHHDDLTVSRKKETHLKTLKELLLKEIGVVVVALGVLKPGGTA